MATFQSQPLFQAHSASGVSTGHRTGQERQGRLRDLELMKHLLLTGTTHNMLLGPQNPGYPIRTTFRGIKGLPSTR